MRGSQTQQDRHVAAAGGLSNDWNEGRKNTIAISNCFTVRIHRNTLAWFANSTYECLQANSSLQSGFQYGRVALQVQRNTDCTRRTKTDFTRLKESVK